MDESGAVDSWVPPVENRRSTTWGLPAGTTFLTNGPSTLTRQPTLRRPMRSRMVDFNEHASRRRSAYRTAADSEDPRSSEDIANTLSPWVAAPSSDEPLGSSGARRFFPFSRRRQEVAVSSMPWTDIGEGSSRPTSPPEPMAFRPWRSRSRSGSAPRPILIAEEVPFIDDVSERSELPRLRRGGLRAPESMLSRHVSPVDGSTEDGGPPPIVISIQRESLRDVAPAEEVVPIATAEESSLPPVEIPS